MPQALTSRSYPAISLVLMNYKGKGGRLFLSCLTLDPKPVVRDNGTNFLISTIEKCHELRKGGNAAKMCPVSARFYVIGLHEQSIEVT